MNKSKDYVFTEDLLFDQDKSVVLKIGFDCGYIANTGTTTVNGNLTISGGSVTIQSGTLKVQ